MNICVVGAGMQGRVVALDLHNAGHHVTVLDKNIHNLKQAKGLANIKTRLFDVKHTIKFIKLLRDFDIVVGALPAARGFYTMECAIEARVDAVDLSYAPENPFLLHYRAVKKKLKIVPDAGFAPGLSNILVGEAYQKLGGIDNLKIRVGGIPQRPKPPFNYRITWSPADLLAAYTKPSRIVRDSKVMTVETLSGVEEFTAPKIGRLECFYTDGLRTLLKTIKHVKNMEEKTIRYPGHAKMFKTIIDCGFSSDQSIIYGKKLIKVRDFTAAFLKEILSKGDEKDLSLLIIEIERENQKRRYACRDYYDEKNKIASMARMTAYTGSIITQCLKNYSHYGVIPPEYLGMDRDICRFIKAELKKRRIHITTRQISKANIK